MHGKYAAPTQVRNPWRTFLRTVVQAVGPILAAMWGLALILPSIAEEVAAVDGVPAEVVAALTAVAGVCAIVSGVVARVMALPGVNDWINRYLPALGTGDTTADDVDNVRNL